MTLRIHRSDECEWVVFVLIGRIQAEQLPGLQTLLRAEPSHNLVLDLREVRLVDRDGIQFLARSEAEGARLRSCPPFIREWIAQERQRMQPTEAEPQQL